MGNIRHLSIDLETYSDVDIKKSGAHAYVQRPDFQILLNSYCFWGEMNEPEVLDFSQGNVLPQGFIDALFDPNIIKHAYNATFEYLCFCRALGTELPRDQWRDTMLHSLYCGYPASLDAAGKAIGLSEDKQKLATGKALIRYFCNPCKPTRANGGRTRNLPQHDPERWAMFKEYNRQTVDFWDEMYEGENDYHDMSVIRTAKLDAFGQKWRTFTDKVIAAYQSDEALKHKIDSATKYSFRIINSIPSYDIVHYYKNMYKVAPEVLGEDFYNELDASFWATVVSKQTSNFLQEKGNSVDASIMLGTKGHYRSYYYNGELDHLELDFFLQYEADGSKSSYYDNEYHQRSPWGGTLESTYCQLAFDNATGWSRWMLLNEQEPFPIGLSDFHYVPGSLESKKQK